MTRLSAISVVLWASSGCATSTSTARPRTEVALPPGCSVEVLRDGAPTRPVRSLGEAVARCTGDAMGDTPACTRALQDQACALGGDTLWGITSSQTDEALILRGHVGRGR